MRSERPATGRSSRGAAPGRTAQRLSLGIALVTLVGIVGAVVLLWRSPRAEPPRFTVEQGTMRRAGAHFYLTITVRNDGDRTASEVTVEGVVAGNGGEERASTTFDFIPGHTTVEAVLVFVQDPTTAIVQVRSFQKP